MRPPRRAVAALASVGLLAALVSTISPSQAAPPRETPVTVLIPTRTVETPGTTGQNGTLLMRVGDSRPIRVIVDTGFSGLLLFPGAWDQTPDGVRMGREVERFRIPHGPRIPAVRGSAVMGFRGVSTTEAIPFLYARGGNAYLERWERRGVYGLLGVGTAGGVSMVNPFTALPGRLGQHWSIHFDRGGQGGAVVLGARAPADARMSFPLRYTGENSVGAPLWNDHAAIGCWSFAGRPEVCMRTWFDAAFTVMRLQGRAFAGLPVDGNGNLRGGSRVTLSAPGAAFIGHSFRAGRQASRNLVQVSSDGNSQINTGNSFYFDYVMTYDLVRGRIAVSDPTKEGSR